MMRRLSTRRLQILCLQCSLIFAASARAEELVLEPQPQFAEAAAQNNLGACSAVAVNSKGEVIVFHRGKRPILVMDSAGRYLRSWGDDLVVSAHGLRIDKDDNVWTTDWQGHRVFKFTPQGKVLMGLGTGQPGDATDQFNKPTDVAFGPEGEIFISDGYGNSRIMSFTPKGQFVEAWGKKGTGDGQFNLPHAVVVDSKGRLLVGDRENNRVQIFDLHGNLLETWKGFAPYGLAFDPQGRLFVADARANKVLRLNDKGEIEQTWGGLGTAPGQFNLPHVLSFDAEGNLYVAEVGGKRVQKFVRKRPAEGP